MKKQIFTLSLLLLFGTGLYAQPKAAGEPRVIAKMSEPLQRPVWSSDGSQLSFTSVKNNDNTNPLLRQMTDNPANVAGQVEALQSLDGSMIFNPVLSPAGDKIVFQASNGKGLYICNADGSGLRSLGKGERATWMPDGKYIVVMLIEDNGEVVTKGELISIHVATGARDTLLSSDKYIALSPAVSPDGKQIAFEEYAAGAIYVMDIK
jgi:Tol biopolymer transport system component